MKVRSKRKSTVNKLRNKAVRKNIREAKVRPAAPYVKIPRGHHFEDGKLVKG